jgi:hypothetical protein
MEPAYFVSQFSPSVLSILIKQCFGSDFRDIETKAQVKTLISQLGELGAQTIVCERAYIDRDYSDDYANYYVQSFKDYRGSCARLHFFSKEFEHEDFHSLLMGGEEKISVADLQNSYLGFVVVKPLPFTFLGRSCIATRSEENISRAYKANLFGFELSVHAIAFQEQDRVVSACATTAVWSLLHALPDLHKTSIPSPSAITLAAIGSSHQSVNTFPNKGLNLVQITSALEALRLKQHSYQIETFNKQEKNYFQKFAQAYIDSKIPIFLGARIFKGVGTRESDGVDASKYLFHGDHAVVITGLNVIEDGYELVVHDDRIGPYLSMKLLSVVPISDNILEACDDKNDHAGNQFAFQYGDSDEILVPTAALVATYPKKKIGVEPIIRTAEFLLNAFKTFFLPTYSFPQEIVLPSNAIEHKVQLLDCKDLKTEYLKHLQIEAERTVLLAHLPRFIWRVQFVLSGQPLLDLLFDATDTPNGNPFIQMVRRDEVFADFMLKAFVEIAEQLRTSNERGFDDLYSAINESALYTYHIDVLRRLAPVSLNYTQYLSSVYGGLRSPRYVKTAEASIWPREVVNGDGLRRHRLFSADMAKTIDLNKTFETMVSSQKNFAIWVIDEEGALVFGPDAGHPTLTDANPARIAGELHRCECGMEFLLNAKSGRYSGQYPAQQKQEFLVNAAEKWSTFFPHNRIIVHPFPDSTLLHVDEKRRSADRKAA